MRIYPHNIDLLIYVCLFVCLFICLYIVCLLLCLCVVFVKEIGNLLRRNFISGRPHVDLLIDVDAGDNEENTWRANDYYGDHFGVGAG